MSIDLLTADESALADFSLDDLLAALDNQDSAVRACAMYALGRRQDGRAIAALAACLSDRTSFLARTAGDALTQIGKAAVPTLQEVLSGDNSQARGLAARALAYIKDPSSIPALFKALEDESAVVQHWANEALDRMGVGQIYFKP